MSGMRKRLIHGYFDVNNDLVWETVTIELPPLITRIKAVIKKEVVKKGKLFNPIKEKRSISSGQNLGCFSMSNFHYYNMSLNDLSTLRA